MQTLQKVSGAFVNLGDTVTLTVPEGSLEAALRLYDNGLEIALWVIVGDPVPVASETRTFQLIEGSSLPANFVKYIGSLLFGGTVDAHVIEVTGA